MAGKAWTAFFMFWAIVAVALFVVAPSCGWWFPGTLEGRGEAMSTIGRQIDALFFMILIITGVTFIGVHIALGYVLWTGADAASGEKKALFSHGSHALEVIWTMVPSGILLFIALYQLDVWASYRMKNFFPGKVEPVAEVTARQFEWRIRYPAPGKVLQPTPQPDDLYTVNDLPFPNGRPIAITLRSDDVQHSFFVPELRVKQDAVPGLQIPIWWESLKPGTYELTCAELCGWGHYKMKARVVAMPEAEFDAWKLKLQREQNDDGSKSGASGGAELSAK